MKSPIAPGPRVSMTGFVTVSMRTGASGVNNSRNSGHARRFTTSAYAFCSLVINASGAAASLSQVGRQGILAGVTVVFSFLATLAILKLTDVTVGLRVTEEHEEAGLDASQHGEVAYRV